MNEPGVDDLLDDVAASEFVVCSNRHGDSLGLLQVRVEMKVAFLVVLRQLLSVDDRTDDGAEGVFGSFKEAIQL